MDNAKEIKKQYLVDMLKSVSGMWMIEEEHELIQRYELRGYTTDDAKQELLNKCRQILLRNDDVTDIIVRYKLMPFSVTDETGNHILLDKNDENDVSKWYDEYIDSLAGWFCTYDFEVVNGEPIENNVVLKEIREVYIASEIADNLNREKEYKLHKTDKKTIEYNSLEDLFDDKAQYKTIMDILAEENLVDSTTYIWIDKSKGNKKILASIIKDLYDKGYFNIERRLTSDEIRQICLNTFKHEVGIDTIKHCKPENENLKFIPHSKRFS